MPITENVFTKLTQIKKPFAIHFFKIACRVIALATAINCCLASLTAQSTEPPVLRPISARNIKQIAPGIWRIHLGDPEKFTPLYFQTFKPRLEELKAFPQVDQLP